MKLATRLKIFGIFATCLVVILGIITYWRFYQVDLALKRNTVANEVVKSAFILTILNDDYIRTHGERAELQWNKQYEQLSKNLTSYQIESPEEQQVVQRLQQGLETIHTHFSQLQSIISQQESTNIASDKLAMAQEAERRLTGQLSVDLQTVVSLTSTLAAINNQRLAAVRQSTNVSILALILLLGSSLVITYLFFARSISRAIDKLTKGTKVLAAGDLDYRLIVKSKDEFGQLADNFNEMAMELKQLDQAKTDFLALASHELRTPITAVGGLVSMILRGDYGPISDTVRRPLAMVDTSAKRQVVLVNELVDALRLKTGRIQFTMTNFSIAKSVEEIVESLMPIAEQKGLKLTIHKNRHAEVYADSNLTKQLLNNLIGNALKFTSKGSVEVSYRLDDKKVYIVVTDTGRGISAEEQKKLFRRFEQINSEETGKPDGSGLGLYISREIARTMGGDVTIEKSEPGKGSTFVFSLPKATAS